MRSAAKFARPGAAATASDTAQFFTVMAASFTVSMGYGVVLPVMPFVLEKLMPRADAAVAAWHTGVLAGIYMLFIFLFAPLWGHISDRIGRRPVILIGLTGYAVTLALFALAYNMSFAYGTRALAGAFVSAVAPIASAFVSETAHEDKRARRLAWLGAGSLAGFLVGPALSGWAAQAGKALARESAGAIAVPLYVTAVLALLVAIAVFWMVPRNGPRSMLSDDARKGEHASGKHSFLVVLALNLLVTFGLGSFEVGITLQMRQSLGYEPSQLAAMFAECSLVMILVQVVVFSPAVKAFSGPRLLLPAFLTMAVGLILLTKAASFPMMIVAVALIAASSGLIMPALTHMVSLQSALPLGAALGAQTSLASIGQAAGSAAAGALYASLSDRLFWVSAAFMVLGACLAARTHLQAARVS